MSNEDELSKIDAFIAQQDVNVTMPEPAARPAYSQGPQPKERRRHQQDLPPPGYKCHRCGESGHFIQDCPAADESSALKQVRQARGIPRAFLQAATEEDLKNSGVGGYVSATGELLVMKKASAEEKARITGESEIVRLKKFFGVEWETQKSVLSCTLCKDLFKNAVVVTCCSSMYCRDCLLKHLEKTYSALDDSVKNRQCPNCPQIIHMDMVIADIRMQNLISQIILGERAILRTPGQQKFVETAAAESQRTPSPEMRKRKNVEISFDEPEEVEETGNLVGLCKVPAGPLNPFFPPGMSFAYQQEFYQWQQQYQTAIKQAGLWDAVLEKTKQLAQQ